MFTKPRSFLLKSFKRLLLGFTIAFIASSLLLVGVFRYLPIPMTTFMLYRHVTDFQEDKDYQVIHILNAGHFQVVQHLHATCHHDYRYRQQERETGHRHRMGRYRQGSTSARG